jgi:hypothetical protein
MSVRLKGKIFYKQPFSEDDVEFYKVSRSTTNTCEVFLMTKRVVYQNEDHQYVEPGDQSENSRHRCRVICKDMIEFKSGDVAQTWDGKPIKQQSIIYLPFVF